MSVLTLDKAKVHLNITGTDLDVELQDAIDSVESTVARRIGPLAPTAVTERVDGCALRLALSTRPVISLTSVTPVTPAGASALPASDLHLRPSGVVTTTSHRGFPWHEYDVAYQAGRSTIDDDLMWALKELLRHFWETQRGSGITRPGSAGAADKGSAVGELPARVEEVLDRLEGMGVS